MDAHGLIGREVPLGVVADAIATVHEHGDAVLLLGERGIGRTACLLAAQRLARAAGHRVISGAGIETEATLPFAGLHRLLRSLLPQVDSLPAGQGRALLTALGMRSGPSPELLIVSLATLGLLTSASADTPLLVSVDDIHWLDAASTAVLGFVARRLDHGRLVIVATSWDRESRPVTGAFREVPLPRLTATAAHRLLEQRAAHLDPGRRDRVVTQADGNPLALVELAAMSTALPAPAADADRGTVPLNPLLVQAFGAHLSRLTGASRDAVLIAAVAVDANVQEVLAATSLMTGRRVPIAVLDPAQSLGLLRYDDTRIHFAHPLTRSAVAQGESVSRRQAAHRALGQAVTVNSARRTWHRANGTAGYDDSVAAELELNSAENIRRGDTPAAIKALERAAHLSTASRERTRRLLLAAKHSIGMGRFGQVDELLATVMSGELSELDRVRVSLLRDTGDDSGIADSDQVTNLCAAADLAFAAGDEELALELANTAAIRGFSTRLNSRARSAVTALADRAAKHEADPRTLSLRALTDPVRHGRGVIAALAKIDGEAIVDVDSLVALPIAVRAVGNYAAASGLLDQVETALRNGGQHRTLARVLCLAADMHLDTGEWDRAAAALADVRSLTAGSNRALPRAEVLVAKAKAAALRGDLSTALELVTETEHTTSARGGSSILARAQIARGIAYLSSGRHVEAYAALSRVFLPRDPSHHPREQFGAVMYLAEAAVRSGQHDAARSTVRRMEPLAEASGSPLLQTQMQYACAVLAPDASAENLFTSCLASDLAQWAWPRARVQLAYGRWLRRQRRVSQSRGPLQAARVTLSRIGAVSWATEALDELEASGRLSEDRRAESAAVSLSVQELKIARLAADGLTNSEIGQQLCLSPRTVGSHLYRIFPKLGITARREIASRLARTQVHDDAH